MDRTKGRGIAASLLAVRRAARPDYLVTLLSGNAWQPVATVYLTGHWTVHPLNAARTEMMTIPTLDARGLKASTMIGGLTA